MPDYNLGTARGKIELDVDGVEGSARKAEKSLGGLKGGMDKFGNSASGLATAGGAVAGAGAAITGGFALAVNSAMSFEKRMSAIEAVSGATGAEMEQLTQKSLDLGAKTQYSASEAASAIEELAKAGLSVPDIMNGAADATVALAAAGEIELPEAATIASNAMNQFGLSAKEMPKIADLIAGAANASAIDVSDFGMSMSQAGAVANLAGLSFDDTANAIAQMGNAGIKGSDAGTSLKTMLSNLQPGTKKQTALFKHLGLMTEEGANQFYDAQGKLKPLAEIQGLLADATKDLTAEQKSMALETMFGSDAIRAAAVLSDEGSAGYNKMAEGMGKVTAESVAMTKMDNLAGMWETLKGSLETIAITIGQTLLPYIKQLVTWVSGMVDKWNALSPTMQRNIVIIAAIVGGLLLLIGVIVSIAAAVAGMVAVFMAAGSIALPILGVVAAIVAVVAIVVALAILIYKNWGSIKAFTISVFTAIKNFFVSIFTSIRDFFVSIFTSIAGFFTSIWTTISAAFMAGLNFVKNLWTTFWNGLSAIVTMVFTWIATKIQSALAFVGGIITSVLTFIGGIWSAFWQGPFGQLLIAVWDLIVALVRFGVAVLIMVIKNALANIIAFWTTVWNAVSGFFSRTWNKIANFIGPIVARIGSAISNFLNKAKAVVSSVLTAIGGFFTRIWNAIKSASTAAFNAVYNAVSGPLNRAKSFVSGVLNSIKTAISNAWNAALSTTRSIWDRVSGAVRDKISGMLDRIRGIKNSVMNALRSAGSWLYNAGRDIINGLINGITNAVGRLTAKLRSITNMIPDWKGPASTDKILLEQNGELVMEGFINGIMSQVGALQSSLGDITNAVPGMVTPTYADTSAFVSGAGQSSVTYSKTINQDVKQFYPVATPASRELDSNLQMASALLES